jgi:diguanylate cyclase (GGDEF)-like protein
LQRQINRQQEIYKRNLEDVENIKAQCRQLENNISSTATLYELTKQISESLNKEEIINRFREFLRQHFQFQDCKVVSSRKDAKELQDEGYILSDLKEDLGFLAIRGLSSEAQPSFSILANQLSLVLKQAKLYTIIQELAITDSLTGVFVRRHILDRLKEELNRSARLNLSLSFIMLDIDRFKDYNDKFGHLVGDVLLKEVSRLTKEHIRQIDLVGRYGGEEFSIVLPDTNKADAGFVAERIRTSIAEYTFKAYDETLNLTVSLGVSSFPEDAKVVGELIEKADSALYRAKQSGRNKVCLF